MKHYGIVTHIIHGASGEEKPGVLILRTREVSK